MSDHDDIVLADILKLDPSLIKTIGAIGLPGMSDHDDIVLADILKLEPSLIKTIGAIGLPGMSDHDDIVLADILKLEPSLIKTIGAIGLPGMSDHDDIVLAEENWDTLVNHLKSSQEKHIPSKLSSTRYNVPWLISTIRKMCLKKRRLYRRAKKLGKL